MMENFTKVEELAVAIMKYADVRAALLAFGWQLRSENLPTRSDEQFFDCWDKRRAPDSLFIIMAFKDNKGELDDIFYRRNQIIRGFAEAEQISLYEAIAILGGEIPYSNAKVHEAFHRMAKDDGPIETDEIMRIRATYPRIRDIALLVGLVGALAFGPVAGAIAAPSRSAGSEVMSRLQQGVPGCRVTSGGNSSTRPRCKS